MLELVGDLDQGESPLSRVLRFTSRYHTTFRFISATLRTLLVEKRATLRSPLVLCSELHLYTTPLDIGVALRFRTEKWPPCAPSLVVLCRIVDMDFREFPTERLYEKASSTSQPPHHEAAHGSVHERLATRT